jgi:hypothetical protein
MAMQNADFNAEVCFGDLDVPKSSGISMQCSWAIDGRDAVPVEPGAESPHKPRPSNTSSFRSKTDNIVLIGSSAGRRHRDALESSW